ncbi:MAG: hypothetical protein JRG86_14395 [Deltaproteobacteria bacterium]|jgi:hypothetical protein|nr:hypothetical protein [Deltaproteobacteria bacterium]MBW2496539.1 hypothetical protein [Deltaproteobacteria bacterium]
MRDAIELEWAGIPSVVVVHDALRGSADAMRRLSGHAEYPYISFEEPANPTASWSEDEIRALVARLAPQVIARLSGESPTQRGE